MNIDKLIYFTKRNSLKESAIALIIIIAIFALSCISDMLGNKHNPKKVNETISKVQEKK